MVQENKLDLTKKLLDELENQIEVLKKCLRTRTMRSPS